MKRTLIGAVAAVLLSSGIAAAQMGAGVGTTTGGGNVCLWTYQIDHTHVLNPRTVLFYMKDGHVWRNDLKGPCPGLTFNGFSFVTPSDNICSNAVPIKVIRTGETCSLGAFSPYMHAAR
jgi:hypothetical protein